MVDPIAVYGRDEGVSVTGGYVYTGQRMPALAGRYVFGDFVSGQRTAPGGDFPLNTSGGGLSYTHPGMFGMFLLIEAVRQLRGECGERQVAGAEVALVNGMGGYLSSSATAILARV